MKRSRDCKGSARSAANNTLIFALASLMVLTGIVKRLEEKYEIAGRFDTVKWKEKIAQKR